MSDSIFTKIINRELPAHFLYEDDDCVVILDKFPTIRGQAVVIPKKEVDYAFDLDDDIYVHLFTVAKKMAKALDTAMNAKRTCLVVEGFEIPHVNIKIFPMLRTDRSLGEYLTGGEEADDEDLAVIATQVQAALDN